MHNPCYPTSFAEFASLRDRQALKHISPTNNLTFFNEVYYNSQEHYYTKVSFRQEYNAAALESMLNNELFALRYLLFLGYSGPCFFSGFLDTEKYQDEESGQMYDRLRKIVTTDEVPGQRASEALSKESTLPSDVLCNMLGNVSLQALIVTTAFDDADRKPSNMIVSPEAISFIDFEAAQIIRPANKSVAVFNKTAQSVFKDNEWIRAGLEHYILREEIEAQFIEVLAIAHQNKYMFQPEHHETIFARLKDSLEFIRTVDFTFGKQRKGKLIKN